MSSQLILFSRSDEDHRDALSKGLQERGFLGKAFTLDGQTHYEAGEDFLHLLSFLGCSPSFCLDPHAGEDFCHISIHWQSSLRFLGGSAHMVLACPQCKGKVLQAQSYLDEERLVWHCPKCGEEIAAQRLHFRRQGGIGNLWLSIWGVEPDLVVPGDELLARLQELVPVEWKYCFRDAQP